jgi:pimeloyl-ACP methyl ester carboxylesterase
VTDSTTLDEQAIALLKEGGRPRRRARPRVSRALAEAADHNLVTPFGEIAAWKLGEGPAVLMVHGWEDDNSLWGPAIEQFARWGRPVAVLDLPGHGFSPAEDASIDSVSEAVLTAARELGPIVAVLGHSYGCAAIIRAVAKGLSVRRAVMLASPVPRTQPRRPLMVEGEVDPAVLARADELRAEHTARQTAAVEETLKTFPARILAIHSIDDEQCALSNSQRMVELAPDADLMLVDGLGHRFVAQDPDVLERIAEFVEAP